MITTCLWSHDNSAQEMAEYYCSVFPESRIDSINHYTEPNPHIPESKAGDVLLVAFTLLGTNSFVTLNGGPYFRPSCAASWMIPCKDRATLDHYYAKLSAVPEAEMCGWVTDKFGISWQIIPDNFTRIMKQGNSEQKARMFREITEMKRLDWDVIEALI